ncbi:MAG: hypothetical protein JWM40_2956 [Frankiales bacterium]|nr:hypothetical protein [Frankiales bacterium]
MSTLSVEDRALRMLAAGDSHIDISSATGLSRDEIAKLQRDFPGTHTQQPRPTAVPQRIGTATPIAGVPNPALSRAIDAVGVTPPVSLVTSPAAPAPAAEAASPLAILQDARTHSVARVRNLADRIGKQLYELDQLIAEHQAAEQARQAEKAAKEKARAEVARLEQQLADAKAKLRTPTRTGRPQSPKQAAAAAENLKRARQPVQCPECGRTFGHAGAMGNHRKTCTGTSETS